MKGHYDRKPRKTAPDEKDCAILYLRRRGLTWSQIGATLMMRQQSAMKRYDRLKRLGMV